MRVSNKEYYERHVLDIFNSYNDGSIKTSVTDENNNGFLTISLLGNGCCSLDNYNYEYFMSYLILLFRLCKQNVAFDCRDVTFIGENFFINCIIKFAGILRRAERNFIIGNLRSNVNEYMSHWLFDDFFHLSENVDEDIKCGKYFIKCVNGYEDKNESTIFVNSTIKEWYDIYKRKLHSRFVPWENRVSNEVMAILEAITEINV